MPIGPTEYRLLHFFITHPERVYSRTQLLDHVWGGSVYVEERTVDVHIRRLRKTLEPQPAGEHGADRARLGLPFLDWNVRMPARPDIGCGTHFSHPCGDAEKTCRLTYVVPAKAGTHAACAVVPARDLLEPGHAPQGSQPLPG